MSSNVPNTNPNDAQPQENDRNESGMSPLLQARLNRAFEDLKRQQRMERINRTWRRVPGEPAPREPASQEPASQEPASQEPASQEPASQEPASQETASQETAPQGPASEAPSSQEPSSRESDGDEAEPDIDIPDPDPKGKKPMRDLQEPFERQTQEEEDASYYDNGFRSVPRRPCSGAHHCGHAEIEGSSTSSPVIYRSTSGCGHHLGTRRYPKPVKPKQSRSQEVGLQGRQTHEDPSGVDGSGGQGPHQGSTPQDAQMSGDSNEQNRPDPEKRGEQGSSKRRPRSAGTTRRRLRAQMDRGKRAIGGLLLRRMLAILPFQGA